MGIVIRQSIITTIISYVGVVIGYFNMLWFFPLVLSTQEFGLFRFVQDVSLFFVPFAQFGLGQGILRFYPPNKAQRGFFSFLILASLISFSIFLAVFLAFNPLFSEWFAAKSPEVNQYHFLLLACTMLLTLSATLETFCRSLLEIVLPSIMREILFRLGSLVLVLLYFTGFLGIDGVLYGLILVYGLSILILLLAILKKYRTPFVIDWKFVNADFLKPFLRYILLTLIGSSGVLIVARVDTIMVPSKLGLALFGVYSIGFFIASVIEIPKRAISQISTPLISESFMRNDLANVNSIYRKVSIHQLVIGLLLFIGIWANLDNLYYYMPKNEVYSAGKWVVLWIGLGKLVDMTAGINSEIIVMSKYYVFNIVSVAILAIFTVLANLLLIPIYGIEGAAIAFALSMLLFNLVKMWFIHHKFEIQPFSIKTLWVGLAGVLVYFISIQIPKTEPVWLDLLIRSGLITLLYVLAIFWINPSIEIRNLYLMIRNKIIPGN